MTEADAVEPAEPPRPRLRLPEPGTYRRAYLDLHWIADLFGGLPHSRDLRADALQEVADSINDHVATLHGLYKRILNANT